MSQSARSASDSTMSASSGDPTTTMLLQMQEMFAKLTEALTKQGQDGSRQSTPESTYRSSESKEPKVNPPMEFSGDRTQLRSFIVQLELVFQLQPSRYDTDIKKVGYACGFLRGTPANLFNALRIAKADHEILTSWEKFVEHLKVNFGDVDKRLTAKNAIYELRQTGSAADYFGKLQQYVTILGWPDNDFLVEHARRGLKSELRDEIARSRENFTTIAELMRFVVPLDIRLYERKREREKEEELVKKRTVAKIEKEERVRTTTAMVGGTSAPPVPARSPLRMSATSSRSTPVPAQRGPRIPKDEIDRRRSSGECLKCCSTSHMMAECPSEIFLPRPTVKEEPRSPTTTAQVSTIESNIESGKDGSSPM